MRYRLRTLLIVLAIGPPLLAWAYGGYQRRHSRHQLRQLLLLVDASGGSRAKLPARTTSCCA